MQLIRTEVPFLNKEYSFVYLGVDHLTFEGDMGGLVWARIFFRKPLEIIRHESFFFSMQEIFPLEISLQDIYFFKSSISPPPPPQKSNGMRAGSDL